MRRSPTLLFATLLSATTALTAPARADLPDVQTSYPEVGGWGQAWGEDDPAALRAAQPAPVRPRPQAAPGYVAPPPVAPLPTHLPMPAPAPVARGAAPPVDEMGGTFPEVGSWGQAWGEDEPASPAVPRSRELPATAALAPSQTATAPTGTVARTPGAPSPDAVAAGRAQRALARGEGPAPVLVRGEDGAGDATGIKHPPRIIPRTLRGSANPDGSPAQVQMVADQVIYDREFNVVTAKGRVEMMHEGRTISADTVSYNLKQDVMGASGNVILTEPSGEITYAEYFELTGDFKNGMASQIRAILADNSRMAALSAQRVGGDRTDFDRAVYTACEPCKDDPGRTPLWQVKANRVTHNQAEAQVEYRDAWLEFWGVPVAYTPYLSHPDPTIKRQSGLLAPVFGMNSKLGPSVALPYFQVISDYEDITLTPRFMTDELQRIDKPDKDVPSSVLKRMSLTGQHRWRGIRGEAMTTASIASDRVREGYRGHVESQGIFELDRTWRAGWQAQFQSDLAYRSLYRIRTTEERPWRMTRPYVEGFSRRGYAMAEMMAFQGNRVIEDRSKSPIVLPHMVYSSISEPGWAGSTWTVDADALAYTREVGAEARRLSTKVGWHLPLVSPDGQVVTVSASMRGDGYHAERVETSSRASGSAGRALPELAVNWRYPLTRQGQTVTQVIEPMAMVAMSPNTGLDSDIPNEDSLAFELDETNVMRPNRLPGLDRVEGGLRGGYGLRWAAYPARGGAISVQAAQGWRQHRSSTFAQGSGFENTLSDYVGRVDITPVGNLTLRDRIRLDKDSGEVRRNEAGFTIGSPILAFASDYGMMSPTTSGTSSAGTIYSKRQYINYGVNSHMSQYWRAGFTLQQDLTRGGAVNWAANTMYSDECFAIVGAFNRYQTDLNGLFSGYHLSLTLVLKSLGEAPITVF